MSERLFHSCPIRLEPGSIIQPGNWGRILRLYNSNGVKGNPLVFIREKFLEMVRTAKFPGKPSRLSAVFLLDSIDEAKFFRDKQQQFNLLYEVEVVELDASQHRGDYFKCQPPDLAPWFDQMEVWAESYWRGVDIEHPEIVIASPVHVIRLVE